MIIAELTDSMTELTVPFFLLIQPPNLANKSPESASPTFNVTLGLPAFKVWGARGWLYKVQNCHQRLEVDIRKSSLPNVSHAVHPF